MDKKKPEATPTMDELMRAALGRTPSTADEPDDEDKPTMDELLRRIVKGDD